MISFEVCSTLLNREYPQSAAFFFGLAPGMILLLHISFTHLKSSAALTKQLMANNKRLWQAVDAHGTERHRRSGFCAKYSASGAAALVCDSQLGDNY